MPEAPQRRTAPEALTSEQVARIAAAAADSKHGRDIVALEVRELTSIADAFIICTGRSNRQVMAIAEHIQVELKKQGIRPYFPVYVSALLEQILNFF